MITEQVGFSVSAAWSSKALYAIPASPSHPPQTVPGSHSQTPSKGWEPQALGPAPQAVTETECSSVSLSKEPGGGLAVTLLVLAVEGHLSPEVVGGRQNPRVMWEQSGHHTVPTLRHLYLHPHRGSSAAC